MMFVTAATDDSTSRKRRAQRRLHRRLGHEPQDDFGDDRQRAFRSDEQLRQVVADDVLDHLAAGADHFPGRQDGLEPEHVALRRAVLERARTAGALGDVAADHRLPQRRRVGRIEQADLLDRVLQVAGDDVGLRRPRRGWLRRSRGCGSSARAR